MFVQVNEAFAAQYVAVEKELGLDRAKTNTNGGAIGKTVSSLKRHTNGASLLHETLGFLLHRSEFIERRS